MTDFSVFRPTHTHTIPPNVSSSSLEIGQILGTNIVNSLLSESVTCASLSSDASDISHAFPPRALPALTTVELGEHLSMFPTLLSGTERKSGHCVMLAAPTAPRLRSMCKECLSITKWAEYSTASQAPEHIPWENVLKNSTQKWVPEGSIFSPESFSHILSQLRKEGKLQFPRDDTNMQENCVATTFAPSTFDSEVLEIMRELQSLRSYFAGTLQKDYDSRADSFNTPLPALVVSTSHVTFPLTLESCQSLAQHRSCTIASRRGKGTLPPLTIPRNNTSADIDYPGIPSAFLGSPKSQPDEQRDGPEDVRNANSGKTLRVEEMINNLRLQCSTMSLQTSVINDPLWNSRSAIPTFVNKKRYKGTSCKIGEVINPPAKAQKNNIQPAKLPKRKPTSRLPPPRCEREPTNPLKSISAIQAKRCASSSLTPRLDNVGKPLAANQTSKQVALRSAMKGQRLHGQKLLKNVRFVLPQSEIQEDLPWSKSHPHSHQIPLTKEVKAPRCTLDSKSQLHVTLPMISIPKIISPNSTSSPSIVVPARVPKEQVASRHLSKSKAQSLSITSPFRKLALSRGSLEVKASNSESAGLHRSHTLGRNSLSRVIKVPMFTPKITNKRATISVDSATFRSRCNEVAQRESFPRSLGNFFHRFK